MSKLKYLFLAMSLFMIYLVIRTSMQSDMFHLPAALVGAPWFKTTLVDFYFNLTIISAWVIHREKYLFKSIAWVLAFIFLGSIATSFYVFLQLNALKEGQGIKDIFLKKN